MYCIMGTYFLLFWPPSYSPPPSIPTPQRLPPFLCCFLILCNIYRVLFNCSYHSSNQGAAVVIWCPFISWLWRALSVQVSRAASVAHNINHPHRTPGQKTGFRGPFLKLPVRDATSVLTFAHSPVLPPSFPFNTGFPRVRYKVLFYSSLRRSVIKINSLSPGGGYCERQLRVRLQRSHAMTVYTYVVRFLTKVVTCSHHSICGDLSDRGDINLLQFPPR